MSFVDQTAGRRVIEWATVPMKVTMIEACKTGDLLACDDTGWTRATNDGSSEEAMLIAGGDSATGDASIEVQAYGEAIIDFTTECSGTVGEILYCGNTEGTYTVTSPTAEGYRVQGDCVTRLERGQNSDLAGLPPISKKGDLCQTLA